MNLSQLLCLRARLVIAICYNQETEFGFLDRNHVPASPQRLLRVLCWLSKGNGLLIAADQANVPPDEYADTTSGVL